MNYETNKNVYKTPNWHKTILQEREKSIKDGTAVYIDWETAKISIKEEIKNQKNLNKS